MKKRALSLLLASSCTLSLVSPALASNDLKPTASNWVNNVNLYGEIGQMARRLIL